MCLAIAPPEASVAEGRGQGAVVTGAGGDLPDQVQMRRRSREAEGNGAGDKGGQDAHRVVEVLLESLDQGGE